MRRQIQELARFNFCCNVTCATLNAACSTFWFCSGRDFLVPAVMFLLAAAIFVSASCVSWKTWRTP